MADLGHELTDEMLRELEQKIKKEYERAARDVARKYEKYMAQFKEDMAKQKALLDAGKITQKDFNDFVYRKTMTGNRWKEMQKVLAEDYHRANEIALKTAKSGMADVYALNANYATYKIESGGGIDTGFTLYNHDTAEYLLKEQRQLMPGASTKKAAEIAANKDLQWNMQKIQSAVLQGVLQGESPYAVADRLTSVAQMNYNSAVRYARTMTTSAQNAGRYEAYRRADRLGVDLVIEWQATLDNRTRHDHRMMHGQRRNVDEPFVTPDGFRILYPADSRGGESDAPQKEIWNCRCTLLSWVKGFEGDTVKDSPKMEGMTFEEWQQAKAPKESFTLSTNNDTINEPRTNQWGFEIGGTTQMFDNESNLLNIQTAHEINVTLPNGEKTGSTIKADCDVYYLPDGAKLYFKDNMDATKQDLNPADLIRSWYDIPETYRAKMQQTIYVVDYENPQDAYWKKKFKDANHVSYMTGGDSIAIWARTNHDPDYMSFALCHEGGHFIDNGNPTKISLSLDWSMAALDDLLTSGQKAVSEYGENSFEEDFAESCAFYVRMPEWLKNNFPQRFKFLEGLIGKL